MDERSRIQEVLARYVRATDARDGARQGALFTDDAVVRIFSKTVEGAHAEVGEPLIGGAGVEFAVTNFMAPHPALGSSHHVTADHIIEVEGDTARLNAQYVVFEVQGTPRPDGGWPAGTVGVQGAVRPIEAGYYDTELRLVDGAWKITRHHVLQDLPFALPDAGPAPSGRA
ncbi:MAG: hypothetical protein QOG76_1770 [Pseudonocardiales bacterium]|jgi:hypothetical protein|nr:hypothetical protein [Pseudonocardiales bacterium]